jgi:hypothetical protein
MRRARIAASVLGFVTWELINVHLCNCATTPQPCHQVLAEQSFQKRKADRGILPMQAEIRFFTAEAVRNDSTISFDVVREDSYFIALTRLPSRDLYLAAVLPCKVPF